jgi:CIC family chloride channel protein
MDGGSFLMRLVRRARPADWKIHPHVSEATGLILLAVVVGIGSGLGAVVFRWLIGQAQWLFFGAGHQVLAALGPYYVIFIPAAGGLLVGLLVYYLAREAKGHGVPEVMLAVSLQSGRIRPRVAIVKSLASAICIGSGGSVGREGPIVQIASTIGSTLGQLLKLSGEKTRLLVACGAAGGIAATFNAPIAGVFFALEVILRDFATRSFGTVVISAVSAIAVSRGFMGDNPAFQTPQYNLIGAGELPLYLVLGILAGVVAVGFVRMLYAFEDFFDAWRFPEFIKPVVGGLVVGTIGIWYPQVFGVGYGTIDLALQGKLVLSVTAILLVAKLLATSLTLGSGGSGGVFAPSLFVGSMLGATFGDIVHRWWPNSTGGAGAYALVGMGAVFAGAAHAPITAVLILFEMTGDYRIILPLMTAIVVSTLVSQWISRESIYTLKLRRRGIDITSPRHYDVLDSIAVDEVMTREYTSVREDLTVAELVEQFAASTHHGFPVVDAEDRLVGIVTLADIESVDLDEKPDLTVGDVATKSILTCYPDETVGQVLHEFGARDHGRIPVVSRSDSTRLVGLLRRSDIVRAYARTTGEKTDLDGRVRNIRISAPGARAVAFRLHQDSPWAGKRLSELALPAGSLVVAIERETQSVLPRGATELRPGDLLTVLASSELADKIRAEAESPAGARK